MKKQDYFVRSCIYNRICVVGKKETIYPLVQTVNALYIKLLEMQKAFTSANISIGTDTLMDSLTDTVTSVKSDSLPSSEDIKELQTEYTNMLTAIIDLLDGAKYLWEGERHDK